jgi:hypothetical protein
MLKLYRVDVVVETVVLAQDLDEASSTARLNYGDGGSYGSERTTVMEIVNLDQLPDGWAKALPFYEGWEEVEELKLTCREVVERFQCRREEEEKEKLQQAVQEREQLKLFPIE